MPIPIEMTRVSVPPGDPRVLHDVVCIVFVATNQAQHELVKAGSVPSVENAKCALSSIPNYLVRPDPVGRLQ